jgi:hypothetical protein
MVQVVTVSLARGSAFCRQNDLCAINTNPVGRVLDARPQTIRMTTDQTPTIETASSPERGLRNARFSLRSLLLFITALSVLLAIGVAIWVKIVAPARHGVKGALCTSNLVKIHRALYLYDCDNGSLPPAYVNGPDGTPAHSWRVLILPYLDTWGIDGEAIHGKYSMSEPWNGPNNRRLPVPVAESRFACPCGTEQGTTLTSYVVLVGRGTLFPGTETVTLSDIPESLDPILVIELTHSDIQWTEPRDLSIGSVNTSSATNCVRLSRPHAGQFRYITARGRIGVLPPGTSVDDLKGLARSGVRTGE